MVQDATNNSTNIHDDIAFMRCLAEQGSRGPVLGGSLMLASGVIYSATAVVSWGMHTGRLPIRSDVPGIEWWAAMGVQVLSLVVLIPLLKRGRVLSGNANTRLFGVIWRTIGMAIGAIFLALAFVNSKFHMEQVFMAMPAVVMALYGAGWSICGAITKRRWMYVVAAISYLAAIPTAWLIESPNGLLAYGALIFAVIAVPGILLMREKPLTESAI